MSNTEIKIWLITFLVFFILSIVFVVYQFILYCIAYRRFIKKREEKRQQKWSGTQSTRRKEVSMGIMRIWIARDKDNELNMFNTEPIREIDFFTLPQCAESEPWISFWPLPKDELPEITWENSPVKYEATIILKPISKGGVK